jgi:hypothetical protein
LLLAVGDAVLDRSDDGASVVDFIANGP